MALKYNQTLSDLRNHHAFTGKLSWIGLRPARQEAMLIPDEAILIENKGLDGDHMASGSSKKRQITLIQAEHIPVIGKLINNNSVSAEKLRRNLVIEGINLLALKDRQFAIGDCILQGTGPCHPCSRMEETLGEGGYNAMRGHGGITAIVIQGGIIKVGDVVLSLAET